MSSLNQVASTIVFWILFVIGMTGILCVFYDILYTNTLLLSQQLFALCLFSSLPIGYGYWSERQDV